MEGRVFSLLSSFSQYLGAVVIEIVVMALQSDFKKYPEDKK